METGFNDHEVMEIIRVCALMGAQSAGYTIVRLNGDVETIFSDWLALAMPDRKDKVLNKVASCHGGTLGDSRFGKRMRGEGKFAEIIRSQFKLAVSKHMGSAAPIVLNTELFYKHRTPQLLIDF